MKGTSSRSDVSFCRLAAEVHQSIARGKACPMWIQELEVQDSVRRIQGNIDTTLIPPGAQYGAIRSNAEHRKPPRYAGIASPRNPLQHMTDHS